MRPKHELAGLADYAWTRLRERMVGMTDEEYLWEPAPGSWSIRPAADQTGDYTWDFSDPPPDPPPMTTIAWRVTHIAAGGDTLRGGIDLSGDRRRAWLGLPPRDPAAPPWTVPRTAAEALEAAERARSELLAELDELTEDDLWQPIGAAGGPYADASRYSYVLHIVDEVIHHGAEIGLLRDLYRLELSRNG